MPTITPAIQTKLNDEINDRFWASTNYKVGQKLDPKDPFDAPMVPVWLQIAKDVAAQYKAGTLKWGAPIDAETDARYWAQTGVKPGTKIDLTKPADQAMAQVWNDIHAKVLAQYLNGTVQWTYDHPAVTTNLAAAADATKVAADALAQAAHSKAAETAHAAAASDAHAQGDVATAQHHEAQAAQHHDDAATHAATAASAQTAAHEHTKAAASVQPATASPELAHRAAHQIQDFVMNGAGQGQAIDEPHDPHDMVGVMQAQAAPARVEEHAQTAPASQTAPAGESAPGIPTFPPSSPEHDAHEHKAATPASRGRLALGLGIGASALAAIGLVAFAVRGNHHVRGTMRRHTYAPRRLAHR